MCAVISASARVQPAVTLIRGSTSDWVDGFQLIRGGPGDHGPSFQLLNSVFKSPTKESFSAALDNPFYEPNDRVLVRRGMRVLSHAQVTQRTIHFGSQLLPVAGLHALATLPEFRRQGFASAVVSWAEELMREDGAEFGTLMTSEPHFFRARGWVVCGRHSLARAHTRHVLAQLSDRGVPAPADMPHIRPMRQVELPSLIKVYATVASGGSAEHVPCGMHDRTEAYWRWLVSRGGFDHIFVAMGGSDRRAWDAFDSPVIGYVVVKENQILELVTMPTVDGEFTREQIAEQLLARACHEAIERDQNMVQFHAPQSDRLFDLFRIAGGEIYQREQFLGEVPMVKLFDPAGFLSRIEPVLVERLSRAGLKTAELGLSIEGEKHALSVSRRGVKFKPGNLGRNYLKLSEAEFVRLLLGHDDIATAITQKRVHAATRQSRELAKILFPELGMWRSPWDEVYL
ncbi:MAG: GNAT family N-acetyltransferase [Planctomycetaceae bacterium]|nr:GNAT family N-acetyltransferase [Planctomycetaceae bacterium]